MRNEKMIRAVVDGREVEFRRSDLVRMDMGRQVAEMRMHLVQNIHTTDRGQRVRFDRNPQWEEVYADPSTNVVLMASAQTGKSLFGTVTLFAMAELGLECGWVLPTDPKRNEFVHDKIERTIQNTQHYADRISDAQGPDSTRSKHYRSAIDNKTTVLHFATAASDRELIAFTADAMFIDEYDRCDRANLQLAPSRMNQSDYRLTLKVSTPTLPGFQPKDKAQSAPDNIESLFLGGDQRMYYIPCPYCGLWQVPDWYKNVVKIEADEAGRVVNFQVRDADWSPGGTRDVSICCMNPECGHPFDRMTLGSWRANNPGAPYRSRWINRLVADIGEPISDILAKYGRSIGNPTAMQQLHNMDLGISYAGGFVGFKDEMFRRCSEIDPYTMLQRYDGGPTTAGIDVNVPYFDVHVSRWERGVRSPQVKIFVGKVQGREALYQVLRDFNVKVALMEQQPELNLACEIQAEAPVVTGCKIIRCKYSSHPMAEPLTISEAGDSSIDLPKLVTLDRTSTIDRLYQVHLNREIRWFSNYREAVDGRLLDEMTRPVRTIVVGDGGVDRYAWINKPDDQLHAACFDMIAGQLGGMMMYQYTTPLASIRDFTQKGNAGARMGVLTPEAQIAAVQKAAGSGRGPVLIFRK